MDYQQFICIGGVTTNAETKTAKNGDTIYTSFGVSVTDSKNRRVSFFATIFGEYGKRMAEYLTKGQQIFLVGRVSLGENKQFSVIVNKVILQGSPKSKDAQPATPPENSEAA